MTIQSLTETVHDLFILTAEIGLMLIGVAAVIAALYAIYRVATWNGSTRKRRSY